MMTDEIKEILKLIVGDCMHDDCGVSVTLPKSFHKYGAIFLHGPESGYVGFTCPECMSTTLIKRDIESFQMLRHMFVKSIDVSTTSVTGRLKYRSFPYHLGYINNYKRILFQTFGIFKENQTISEVDVRIEFQTPDGSLPKALSDSYWSYGIGDPIIGPKALLCWYEENQIQELLEEENTTGLKVFPRYFPENALIEKADDFIYTYFSHVDELQWLANRYGPEADNPVNTNKRDIYRSIHFMSILDAMVKPSHRNDGEARFLIASPEDLGGVSTVNMPADEIPEILDEEGFRKKLRTIDYLWDNFSERDVQHTISSMITQFKDEYIKLSQGLHFSFDQFWDLKENLLKETYQYIFMKSLERQRYALFREGATWTLVFDGKNISGLKGQGYKYIQYMIQHCGRKFSLNELLLLDGATINEVEMDPGEFVGFRIINSLDLGKVLEIADDDVIKSLNKTLEGLKERRSLAESDNNVEQIKKIDSEIIELKSYHREYVRFRKHRRQFPSESQRNKNRITKSIERAIKQIRKYDEQVYQHFIKAITPINTYNPSYSPSEPIDWNTN